MKRWGRLVGLGIGVLLFCLALRGTDAVAVWDALRKLGFLAPWLLLPYFAVYAVDTWAWRLAFSRGPGIRYWRLFRIRWCGEAVNNLLPTAYVGGEAVKVLLLKREGVSGPEATAAALVSKTAQTIGQVLFLLAGVGAWLALRRGAGGADVYWGLTLILAGGALVVVFLLWMQRRGISATVLPVLERLGVPANRFAGKRAALERMDATLEAYYRLNRGRFAACVSVFFLGWMLDTVEVYLAARWLGMPITWPQALIMESMTGVVKIVGLWVPGALGVQESGIVLLARWVGAPGVFGPIYALLRRARELAYAGLGLGLLWLSGGLDAATSAPPSEGSSNPR